MLNFELNTGGLLRVIGFIVAFLWIYLTRPSVSQWYKILPTYMRIVLHRKKVKSRFPTYDVGKKNPSLEELGFIPHPIEYQVENPQIESKNDSCDGVHFIGVDSTQNFLDVGIVDIGNEVANIWIVLKLSDGSVYELPHQPDTRTPYIRNDNRFTAGGLSIQCHSPLRRWRISFNGLLRKLNQEGSLNTEQVYVKFSFIWMSVTLIHDNAQHYSSYELAKSFESEKHHIDAKCFTKFEDVQNSYEQWGQLMGTVQESGKSQKDLYLWSVRERHLENPVWDSDLNFVKVFLYFKDGTPIKLEVTSLKGLMHSFFNGYTVTAGGKENAISNCSLQLEKLSEEKSTQKVFFTYSDCNGNHNIALNVTNFKFHTYLGHKSERTLNFSYVKARIDGEEDGFGVVINGFK